MKKQSDLEMFLKLKLKRKSDCLKLEVNFSFQSIGIIF